MITDNLTRIKLDYDRDVVVLQSDPTSEAAWLDAMALNVSSADRAFSQIPKFEGWDWRFARTETTDGVATVLLLCEPGVSNWTISTTSDFRARVQITAPVVGAKRLEIVFAHHDEELQQSVLDALERLAA